MRWPWSHSNADHAIKNGYFNKSLVPVYNRTVAWHWVMRSFPSQTTAATLAELKPSFSHGHYPLNDSGITFGGEIRRAFPDHAFNHVHHAGNSSGVVDGAAAVLLASPEYARAHGLKRGRAS